jgi:hypothetical protein
MLHSQRLHSQILLPSIRSHSTWHVIFNHAQQSQTHLSNLVLCMMWLVEMECLSSACCGNRSVSNGLRRSSEQPVFGQQNFLQLTLSAYHWKSLVKAVFQIKTRKSITHVFGRAELV